MWCRCRASCARVCAPPRRSEVEAFNFSSDVTTSGDVTRECLRNRHRVFRQREDHARSRRVVFPRDARAFCEDGSRRRLAPRVSLRVPSTTLPRVSSLGVVAERLGHLFDAGDGRQRKKSGNVWAISLNIKNAKVSCGHLISKKNHRHHRTTSHQFKIQKLCMSI